MIELVKWSDEFQTGLLWQDFQHKELLDNISLLNNSIQLRIDDTQIEKMYMFLSNYVNQHFAIEESYMKKYGYPNIKEHLEEHSEFINCLILLDKHKQESNVETRTLESVALCKELNDWFITHIQTYDKKLGEFLGNKP